MKRLLCIAVAATCAVLSVAWPAAVYARTEAENKEFLKSLVLRFHYTCPEVKSYEPLEGSATDLLIMCGEPGDEYGNRDMCYVLDTSYDNRVRKVKIAPRTYWEWFVDWF